eukprot:1159865-Pelagomonas_calceolata.AAC.11
MMTPQKTGCADALMKKKGRREKLRRQKKLSLRQSRQRRHIGSKKGSPLHHKAEQKRLVEVWRVATSNQ